SVVRRALVHFLCDAPIPDGRDTAVWRGGSGKPHHSLLLRRHELCVEARNGGGSILDDSEEGSGPRPGQAAAQPPVGGGGADSLRGRESGRYGEALLDESAHRGRLP